MVQDNVNKVMREILDGYGREKIAGYTLKHKRRASKSTCQLMESKIRRSVKIDGFRDPNLAPDIILIKNLVVACAKFPSLEQAVLRVWADLNWDMKAKAQNIITENNQYIVIVFRHEEETEQLEKLYKLIDKVSEQLLLNSSYNPDDARLMAIYTISKNLNIKDIEKENTNYEDQEEQVCEYENVDLDKWFSCLESLPATSEVWDEIDDFIRLTMELSIRKKQEMLEVKRLKDALCLLNEECQEELKFFEVYSSTEWFSGHLKPEQYENLAIKIERLVLLFQKHTDLRCGEKLTRNISEEKDRRKNIDDLEFEIKQICNELTSELAEQENRNELVSDKPVGNLAFDIESMDTESIWFDKESPQFENYHQDESNVLMDVNTEIEDDINFGFEESCGELECQTNEASNKLTTQLKAETEQGYANEPDEPIKFEVLYEELQVACVNSEDVPRAWILYKTCQELYAHRAELGAIPTPTLMELYYLSSLIHRDPILYSTRRKHLDSLAGAIKVADLSQAQAVMHFAVALPLVLAHAYDPLRASFFYAEYIPSSFEPMYSMLVEQSSKVNVPIIELCGAEQKQHQNDEQRRKICERIEQAFNQYSAKNKTSIDAFLFPRYGIGPLQWIRDGVKNQICGPEFKDRLIRTKGEDVFALFTGQKDASVHDHKLASITSVRGGAMEKIQHILNLASAWVFTCDQTKELEDFNYKAFKQLQLLFDENYVHWIADLQNQTEDLMVAGSWMKQSLEQLLTYMRGVKNAVEYSK